MKTLNFLRALFFRDVRTLFRSVLAAELGTILLWCFLVISQGKEQLPFVALLIPALSVPLLLMKRDGGERMFPYPLWTVVLGKYLMCGVSFLVGLVVLLGVEKLLPYNNAMARKLFPFFVLMGVLALLCCFPAAFAYYGREKREQNTIAAMALAVFVLCGSGWIMEQCYEAIAAHPGMTVVVMVLAMCVSFLLSVRLYER